MTAPLPPCRLTMREIIGVTAHHFAVGLPEMLSQRRDDRLVQARHAAAYVIKDLLPRSYPEIGRALGNRDHATVIHGIRSAEERIANDPVFKGKVEAIHAYCQRAASLAQPDVNPFEAAVKILSSPRAATGASVETIRDLAAITMAALKEASRQSNEAARDLGQGLAQAEKPELSPANAEIEQLRAALAEANARIKELTRPLNECTHVIVPAQLAQTLRDWTDARIAAEIASGPGLRAANQRVEKASIALLLAAETHFNIQRKFK